MNVIVLALTLFARRWSVSSDPHILRITYFISAGPYLSSELRKGSERGTVCISILFFIFSFRALNIEESHVYDNSLSKIGKSKLSISHSSEESTSDWPCHPILGDSRGRYHGELKSEYFQAFAHAELVSN